MTDVQVAVDETAESSTTERPERAVLLRYAPLNGVEGRTVDVKIVPYGVPAEVSDDRGHTFYREEWIAGAFDEQLVAGHRLKVLMNFEHQRSIENVIGKGVTLRSESDGLHGTFEIRQSPAGDTALDLVNDGILDGISLEAYAKKTVRTIDGLRRRVKAHLDGVALCRYPAFTDARVLAVREDLVDEVVFDEQMLPIPLDPDLVERCRQAGMKLPQRYQAHPAETDTPAPSGTSEDGTRQATET